MPNKKTLGSSHSDKLLRLFTRLFFSDRRFSLTELSDMLGCSKQTVQRLIDDIRSSTGATVEETIENNRKYFHLPRRKHLPAAQMLSTQEMQALQMCAHFAQTLLGRELFDEAAKGIEKSSVLLPVDQPLRDDHFASLSSGHIDYSPHQSTLSTLIEAMESKRVCVLSYRRLLATRTKRFRIKPLKLFSYRDTVYLHTRRAKEPHQPWKEPAYHPLLAVHRIESVEITDQLFALPKNYDFDRDVQAGFGVWQNEPFEAQVRFTGWAADYVAERTWSRDQRIERLDDGSIILRFTARGRPEVLGWVMSFGSEARVLEPSDLVEELRSTYEDLVESYSGRGSG